MLAFGRSLLGDSTHRKTEKPLTESYNVLGDCLDKLSLALAKLTKGNAMAGVLARDKDNQSHSVASLRLEIERLTDYANEITAENNELMGRLGLFEDEILNLQQQLKKANEAKEEAEERSDYLQINLNQKSKDYEHLKDELSKGGITISGSGQDRQNYLNQLTEVQHTVEYLELKSNQNEEEIKTLQLDLQTEKEFNQNLKKEVSELKGRLEELEQAKRDYLNGMGTMKLGISTLGFFGMLEGHLSEGIGFSKIFQHPSQGSNTPGRLASELNTSRITSNDRESIIKVVKKTGELPQSNVFDIAPPDPATGSVTGREQPQKPLDFFTPSELRMLPPPLALKNLPPVDGFLS